MRGIKGCRYNGQHYSDISDFSPLVETMFEQIDYEPNYDFIAYKDYYLLSSLFSDDKVKSATIHTSDGMLQLYNASLEVIRNGEKVNVRSITPNEYLKKLGLYNLYIEFVLKHLGIKKMTFNKYKKMLPGIITNRISLTHDYAEIRGAKALRRILFGFYISDKDILDSKELTSLGKNKVIFKKPMKKEAKPKPQIQKASRFNVRYGERYLKNRGISIDDNLEVVTVSFNGGAYTTTAICFRYPSGFAKLRIISEGTKMRYIANTNDGAYENLYVAKEVESSTAIITEGEFEALTIAKYVDDCSVYALHNTNSLPVGEKVKSQLSSFEKLVVLIDTDTYETSKDVLMCDMKKLFPDKEIKVVKKIDTNKKIDINDLHCKKLITEEIIKRWK